MLFANLSLNPVNVDNNKPFKLYITKSFIFLKIFIWPFFLLFWTLLFIGIIAAIVTTIKEHDPIYFIPILIAFWAIFLWLFFYVWGWMALGSNYPETVEVNDDGAKIFYSIKLFNYTIPRKYLVLKNKRVLGTEMLYIKSKKRIKGIYLNKNMYRQY